MVYFDLWCRVTAARGEFRANIDTMSSLQRPGADEDLICKARSKRKAWLCPDWDGGGG